MSQSQLQAKQKEEAAKGRKLMDAYFARIQRLVENKALDSRLRFMLMDIQEQRQRGWQVRRKAEGPMKIEVSRMRRGGVWWRVLGMLDLIAGVIWVRLKCFSWWQLPGTGLSGWYLLGCACTAGCNGHCNAPV